MTTIRGEEIVGSTDVRVIEVLEDGAEGRARAIGPVRQLEVWYRAGCRPPRVGERVATWIDGATPYAMAPRR